MNLSGFARVSMLACAVLLVATAASAQPSNKWRIQVSEGAKSDGEIVLRVTPKGGGPVDVVVQVADGTGENAVARLFRDELGQKLDKAAYTVAKLPQALVETCLYAGVNFG
jgi:hypothetical protein